MATYNSNSTEEPGQYPAPSFAGFGLPAQNGGTGAPGTVPQSREVDAGSSNEPGQYPARETFTGVALGGTGAPGSAGVGRSAPGGPDSVTYTQPTFYKGQDDGDTFGMNGQGYAQTTTAASVSGEADWTQANPKSYGPGYNMPGVEGNTPTPGSGQFQTGSGRVLRGGYMNGQR